jgi:exopolysaccharide biosynthesis polyprenyl glycosylphosphotransferase
MVASRGHEELRVLDRPSPDGAGAATTAAATHRRRGWFVRRLLLAADLVSLLAAFSITQLIFLGRAEQAGGVATGTQFLIFLVTLPGWVIAAKIYGLYDRDEERANHSTVDEFVEVFHLVTVVVWLFFAGSWITGLTGPSQVKLATFWALAIGAMVLARGTARSVARRLPAYVQRTIIVGAGDVGQLVARKVVQHPEYGIDLLGFVDSDPKLLRGDLGPVEVLGPIEELEEIVDAMDVERVVIAFSQNDHLALLQAIRALRERDIQVDLVPRLFEALGPRFSVHAVEGLPLMGFSAARIPRSSRLLKRTIDVVVAGAALVVSAPLFLYIAIRIKRDSSGPVFYRQQRLGMGMRPFELFKFRTMHDGTDDRAHRDFIRTVMDPHAEVGKGKLYKLDRNREVTRFGRWLRRTSLDELPQLLNVLRGEMSLVGPRPCIPYETDYFDQHHFERFLVPAGMTGFWQVAARAHSTFREALDFDVAYARSWSLGLDLQLLCRTPLAIFRGNNTR